MLYVVWFIIAGEAHWIGRADSPESVGSLVAEYLNFPEYRLADVRIERKGGAL
jgi:hypothetical protein